MVNDLTKQIDQTEYLPYAIESYTLSVRWLHVLNNRNVFGNLL